jgi:complex III assembly factor LYRM7
MNFLPRSIPSIDHHLTVRDAGDVRVLDAARQQIRQGFRDKATLPTLDPEVEPSIKHAEEVANFLRTNLVQGEKNGDRYSKRGRLLLQTLLLTSPPSSELRIHKDIERGDNDTVKLGNKTVKIDGKKCSDL